MYLWIMGFATAICLALIPLIAKKLKDQVRNVPSDTVYESPLRAVVTGIQTKQDWKYGEGLHRNSWDAPLTRQKIWQTYYVITAQWMHPLTKQTQSFCWAVWSDHMPKKPVIGDIVLVAIDFDNSGVAIHSPIDQIKILRVDPYVSLSSRHL
jgi:hypothetical protein